MSEEDLRKAIQYQIDNYDLYEMWWYSAVIGRIQHILDPVGEKDEDLWEIGE